MKGVDKLVSHSHHHLEVTVVLDIRLTSVGPPCPLMKSISAPSLHFPATIVMVMAYCHRLVRSMANPAWSAGVMGAYYESSMAGIVGQIVQQLCHVQFQHVPFYMACYIWWNMSECVRIPVQPLGIVPPGFQQEVGM